MAVRPDAGFCNAFQHGVFGKEHLFPGEVFIPPDVLRRSLGCQWSYGQDAFELCEAKSVVACGFIGVSGGLRAATHGEVVKFDVL